jgi:hypothetical protein
MARKVFYSFHYHDDVWRTSQIRHIGIVEGDQKIIDHEWEKIKYKSDEAIYGWIDNQLRGRSCTIVLIGEKTAGRKFINYEIKQSWNAGKGVFGIYIHNLKDNSGNQASKGRNPFDTFTVSKQKLSSIIKTYDPPYLTSKNVYDYILNNIEAWVETAIKDRTS